MACKGMCQREGDVDPAKDIVWRERTSMPTGRYRRSIYEKGWLRCSHCSAYLRTPEAAALDTLADKAVDALTAAVRAASGPSEAAVQPTAAAAAAAAAADRAERARAAVTELTGRFPKRCPAAACRSAGRGRRGTRRGGGRRRRGRRGQA